jgi:hypothetical protein
MGWARELTEHEKDFCQALGEVVVFWNHVEQSFRILLQRATHIGGPDGRLWSLIAHLTPVQLKDAMIALSSDHDAERQTHLKHCAALFDREREFRNHYVHGPLTFLTTEHASEALVSGVVARGGTLRLHQAKVTAAELIAFRDRLGALQSYIGELLEDSRTLRAGKPLNELAMPTIAPRPVVDKQSWWDLHDHNGRV